MIFTYDIEAFPNVFTCVCKNHDSGQLHVFEWSDRRNDIPSFIKFIELIKDDTMVGFNNIGFDYPVIHMLLMLYPQCTVTGVYNKVIEIIKGHDRFGHIIWPDDRLVRQIDLFKIHHFDNMAKSTSLKMLEFVTKARNIQDLPFPPGTMLQPDQIDTLIKYNINDVVETEKFYKLSEPLINFRDVLSKKYGKDFTNSNDTKVGKDYFAMELEKVNPGCCSHKTPRASIALSDVVLHYIKFDNPEFNKILTWFKSRTITETKGSIKNLSCTVNDFKFVFGTGGLHGSIDSAVIRSDDTHAIVDVDVTSYYPSLAIVNGFYPDHLGPEFCRIYADIKNERMKFKKGTPENALYKLALNGVYGDSNNQYSPFYDPQYTMSITINGQLLLCVLAEQLMQTPGLELIQANTDGLTYRVPRNMLAHCSGVCKWWEQLTGLELEEAQYSAMMIRDVNNYIALFDNGKIKRKGCYEYKLGYHQNHSALVIPKAAEAFFLHGTNPEDFLRDHDDTMDYMLRTKVPRSSRLMWGDEQIQNISRYYISTTGKPLTKVMPPLAGKNVERRIGINVGWLVTECNNLDGHRFDNINYNFYLTEIKKVLDYWCSSCYINNQEEGVNLKIKPGE